MPFASLLITRPAAASQVFVEDFGPWPVGLDIITTPLLEIVPTGNPVQLQGAKGVIFSSVNGVSFGGPAHDMPAYCVGPVTTQAAQSAGWNAVQVGDTSDALKHYMAEHQPDAPLLHIGGRHRRGAVAAYLNDIGIKTTSVDVYDQRLLPLTAAAQTVLCGDLPVIVPLFSPRTARQFAKEADVKAPVHFVAISNAVLQEVANVSYATQDVAAAPNGASLVETLRKVLRRVEAAAAPQ